MRMYQWGPQMIRYMCEAAEQSDYNQRLAAAILPYLKGTDHVCDAGCGLGHLSLELAKYVRKVTALDRNPDALAVLEEKSRGIGNLEICCETLENVQPKEKFDAMVFCLFGGFDQLEKLHGVCTDRVIFVRRYAEDELWPKEYAKGCAEFPTATETISGGAIREKKRISLPLNQPLRDLDDARAFLTMYQSQKDWNGMADEKLETYLIRSDKSGYNYELPVTRRLEITCCDLQEANR